MESDGPISGKYSMVCFAAVKVVTNIVDTFFGKTKPISKIWLPESLAISGVTREEHEKYPEVVDTMDEFYKWIQKTSIGRPIFISDNNGYDFAWINYYFYMYAPQGNNPFGWSSRRIGDLYCGLVKDSRASWNHLRKTKHDHNPLHDAIGNAEALLAMKEMGLKIDFK